MDLAIDKFNTERFGLVTGSVCSVLFPKKSAEVGKDTLARKLANQLYFQTYDEVTTWQTEHGSMGEHFALEHFQKYYDADMDKGRWIKDGDIGGNTDAEAKDYGADFKCPTSLETWLDYLYDGLTPQQINQAKMYMRLTGYYKWLICPYLLETQKMTDMGLTYPVPEDKRMLIFEVYRDNEWEEKLSIEVPKVIARRDEYIEILKLKFPK